MTLEAEWIINRSKIQAFNYWIDKVLLMGRVLLKAGFHAL